MQVAARITIATAFVVTMVSTTYAVLDLRERDRERDAEAEQDATALASTMRTSIEAGAQMPEDLRDLSRKLTGATSGWQVQILSIEELTQLDDSARRRFETLIGDPSLVLVDRDHERVLCSVPLRWKSDFAGVGPQVLASLEVSRPLDLEAVNTDRIQAALMVLFVVGLSTLAVAVIARGAVSRPIKKLLSGIDDVAKGDLSHVLLSEREDEIGQLATRFNEMTFSLRESLAETSRQNENKVQLEQRLGQTEKLATIGQLAAEIAHEVGTPLNVIAGRARATQRKAGDSEAAIKNATIIAEQTARITKIIQRLLDFSRRKVGHELAQVHVDTLAATTVELLAGQFTAGKVKPELHSGHNVPAVTGDQDRLQQVLINLLLNAIQAMPNGGVVHVTTSTVTRTRPGLAEAPPQPFVCLEVLDGGQGIPADIRDRVFDPFFTTKDRHGGTGLGLAVCSGIVKEHDGWIEIADAPNPPGTQFRVLLPTIDARPSGSMATASAPPA